MTTVDFFSKAIRKDKRYLKFKEMISAGAFKIDVNQLLEELKSMMITRKIRYLKYKQVISRQQKYIIEAALQNQAYRSRCAEIMTECNTITMMLEKHLKELGHHFRIKYRQEIVQSGYKTISQQKSAIDNAVIFVQRHIDMILIVEKACKNLIEDIDKAGFLITHLTNLLGINSKHERNF